jgi:hypothetical protein
MLETISYVPTIVEMEGAVMSMEQAECPVYHRFYDGIYVRELHMKAGTFAIGHEQKFEQSNLFIKGKVLMYNLDGSTEILTAPMAFKGKPGRKVGYVLEDVIWQNAYPTNERDVELLETMFRTNPLSG